MPTHTTPAAYVASLDADRKKQFAKLRTFVRKALPGARETMAYKMPTYEIGDTRVAAIGAQKRYFALYLCESQALERQRADFAHLDLGKGCIRFRSFDELPADEAKDLLAAAADEARTT